MKEKVSYKNKNREIIKLEYTRFGRARYMLFDKYGNWIKDIVMPFKIADYL